MGKKFFEKEDIIEDEILETEFIKLEDEREIHLKFHIVTEKLEVKEIIKDIKNGKTILFIDLSHVSEDVGNLRIFINKIKRISETYSITMKIYGKNWLIILPKNVNFHIGEE